MDQRKFADAIDKSDADHPTSETDRPNLSTEHQRPGDAARPSETLDRGQPSAEETIPRKSSLTGND
jgi:hypothetical protein